MDNNRVIRDKLFDLCNDHRLSAAATTEIMESGTNYFFVDGNGIIQPLDKRWLSPQDYVSANAEHLTSGNTVILGQAKAKSEDEKFLARLAKLAEAGDMAGYRKLRQQRA